MCSAIWISSLSVTLLSGSSGLPGPKDDPSSVEQKFRAIVITLTRLTAYETKLLIYKRNSQDS